MFFQNMGKLYIYNTDHKDSLFYNINYIIVLGKQLKNLIENLHSDIIQA